MSESLKVAIVYDFDGTLAQGNIQENSFIPNLGMTKELFWQEVEKTMIDNDMDGILAYMYCLLNKAKNQGIQVTKQHLKEHGKNVRYFSGVESYFPYINDYAKQYNICLEHYIISSGTKEMIEGTSIAKYFTYIYASSFKYYQNEAIWPAVAINYTTKTQYLFRINKGIEHIWDHNAVNHFLEKHQRRIPFKNIIYIGDGLTDVPAMKLLKKKGGVSIGVYDPQGSEKDKQQVEALLSQDRVNYTFASDFGLNKPLVNKIQDILGDFLAKTP